jgi:hypothetical protein
MSFMAAGAVIYSRFVPVLALIERFVAAKTAKCWFRGSGMRIVAINALRFKHRGMNNFTGCLGLVARFACSPFHGDFQKSGLRGTVRIVAFVTSVSQDQLAMPA